MHLTSLRCANAHMTLGSSSPFRPPRASPSYNVPRPANMAYDDFDRNSRRLIHLRVVNVLKHWIEKYSSDFFDPKSADGFSQLAYDVARFARNILHADNPTHARMILQVLGRLVWLRILAPAVPLRWTCVAVVR